MCLSRRGSPNARRVNRRSKAGPSGLSAILSAIAFHAQSAAVDSSSRRIASPLGTASPLDVRCEASCRALGKSKSATAGTSMPHLVDNHARSSVAANESSPASIREVSVSSLTPPPMASDACFSSSAGFRDFTIGSPPAPDESLLALTERWDANCRAVGKSKSKTAGTSAPNFADSHARSSVAANESSPASTSDVSASMGEEPPMASRATSSTCVGRIAFCGAAISVVTSTASSSS
mmetsp:Transcript_43403/g.120006  ORF Transcript_43403/g.120006 Transcript_43403/m.120006 type:complete len:236 (+) Transcript_43403:1080-1787(+)